MKYDLVEKEIFDYYLQVDPGNSGVKTALYDCISMIVIGESRSKINYMGFNPEPYLSYIALSFKSEFSDIVENHIPWLTLDEISKSIKLLDIQIEKDIPIFNNGYSNKDILLMNIFFKVGNKHILQFLVKNNYTFLFQVPVVNNKDDCFVLAKMMYKDFETYKEYSKNLREIISCYGIS